MTGRNPYTESDEDYLAQYIAKYCPQPKGRSGNALYKQLVDNKDGKWPFSKRHSWQSWRDHYVSNKVRMDNMIAKDLKPGRNPEPATPRESQPTPAQPPESAPSSQAKRTMFTREDDQNIIDYLAKAPPSRGKPKGQKFWQHLVDEPDKYPWAQRRGWQSWRERYVNNAAYFDRAVKKQLLGEKSKDEELDALRPRTAEDVWKYRPSSQAASSALAKPGSPEKRKRVSDAAQEAPPKKRKRGEAAHVEQDEQPEAGPSRRRDANREEPTEREGKGPTEDDEQDDDVQVVDGQEESDEDGDGDDDDQGPVGSDDYRNEIFDPAGEVDSSGEEREETFQMLTDDNRGNAHDDDEMQVDDAAVEASGDVHDDVEDNAQEVAVSQDPGPSSTNPQPAGSGVRSSPPARRHQPRISREFYAALGTPPVSPTDEAQARHHLEHDHSPAPARKHVPRIRHPDEEEYLGTPQSPLNGADPGDDSGEVDASPDPGPSGATPGVRSSPPSRKHHPRVERDFDPALGTPPISPTDEVQARHHLEHDHSPAPARKHVPRIRRAVQDDYFGTPQSTSNSGTAVSSPTSERIARVRKHGPADEDDTDDAEPVKRRAPPRLEEGAWIKAFSDIRGKSRVSSTGRRKSGVDFEDEARIIGVQDTPGSPADQDDEDEDAPQSTPVQWPPIRRKNKVTAPSTPVAGRSPKGKGKARADADVDSTVRTEKIVSVKTVRTVERRFPRASNGTPYVRGALAAAQDEEDEDEEDEAGADPTPSQHHPFSQPVFAPKMTASASNQSTASNAPVPREDVTRLQRMLSGQVREAPQPSPSKAERDARLSTDAPHFAPPVPRAGPRVRANLSRETISPPGAVRDDSGERFDEFEERDEELPGAAPAVPLSPLANKGVTRPSERRILEELAPQASSFRMSMTNATSRVDKGKAKATGVSHATGHTRRHTLAGPDARDVLTGASHDNPAATHHTRRSVPSAFTIGDDLPLSAFSLLFNPPRSGSAHPRSYSLAHPPGSGSSRSLSPHMSADVAAAKRLPPNELDMVLNIGIRQVFCIMAENHGFGEAIVRDVFAATGSLQQTDVLLCKMRESANKTANEVLQSMDGDDDEDMADADDADADDGGDDDAGHDEAGAAREDDDQVNAREDQRTRRRSARTEEDEVEQVLDRDSWMQDDAPLAESSRFDASHSHRGSSFGPDSRKRKSLIIQRVSPEPPSPVEYSPPKRTRAGKHVARQSLSRAPDAMDVDSATHANARSPDVGHVRPSTVGLGQLARYSVDQWRRLGSDQAKMATGKALAKFLQ